MAELKRANGCTSFAVQIRSPLHSLFESDLCRGDEMPISVTTWSVPLLAPLLSINKGGAPNTLRLRYVSVSLFTRKLFKVRTSRMRL